jgi:peptidoglycan/xylan/chitin deacetylase (PgdA/CDA1 family)
VTPRLLRAYRATRYEADGIAVVVGRRSPAMDSLLRRFGVRTAVFVTAWNPRSRLMPAGWNQRMQRALAERLRKVAVLPAAGASRGWREEHVLALAAPHRIARLARTFRQNAVVVVRLGAPATLTLV